jgi:hypothetical protein
MGAPAFRIRFDRRTLLKLTPTSRAAALLFAVTIGIAAPQSMAKDANRPLQQATSGDAVPRQPRAKSKAEYDAYQAAFSLSDPAALEQAATTFAQRYPASELRSYVFQRAMGLYEQAQNPAKTLDMARAVLKYDPNNPVALLSAARMLAEQTRDEDLDRNERLKEAASDAQGALQHAGELMQPANLNAGQFAESLAQLRSAAHEVLATVAYKQRDYRNAIVEYSAAIEAPDAPAEPLVWLRMATAYDKLDEFSQGIGAAEKAIAASQPGTPLRELAEQENARLKARATAALEHSRSSSEDAPAAVRNE